jgi:hypothetical protein
MATERQLTRLSGWTLGAGLAIMFVLPFVLWPFLGRDFVRDNYWFFLVPAMLSEAIGLVALVASERKKKAEMAGAARGVPAASTKELPARVEAALATGDIDELLGLKRQPNTCETCWTARQKNVELIETEIAGVGWLKCPFCGWTKPIGF